MDRDGLGGCCGFSAMEVAALAGVSFWRIDRWTRTGFLPPSIAQVQGAGYGRRRLYSFGDVLAATAAARLLKAGMSLQALRKVVAHLRKQVGYQDVPGAAHPLAGCKLITDGRRVYTRVGESVMDLLTGQTAWWVLDIASIVDELREAVAERTAATPQPEVGPASAGGDAAGVHQRAADRRSAVRQARLLSHAQRGAVESPDHLSGGGTRRPQGYTMKRLPQSLLDAEQMHAAALEHLARGRDAEALSCASLGHAMIGTVFSAEADALACALLAVYRRALRKVAEANDYLLED